MVIAAITWPSKLRMGTPMSVTPEVIGLGCTS
jgi:hypothetical protein